jgi:two-component system LytT family sensor kinase
MRVTNGGLRPTKLQGTGMDLLEPAPLSPTLALTPNPSDQIVELMQKAWTPPVRWVFAVATFLGVFSTLQAYRLMTLDMQKAMEPDVLRLLVLNLAYWYVPAALTGAIFSVSHRFRLDAPRWRRALAAHAVAALAFSLFHFAVLLGVRLALWPAVTSYPSFNWFRFSQRIFLTNMDWTLMTYSAIVGLSHALAYYRESQARAMNAIQLEAQLSDARLRTLQAELHPHFLFNTLHAISTLVHTKPDLADRMISRLSDLLRLTFDRSGASRVPLQEELEFLQKYLEIEQTRFQDRLTVRFEIDPETLDAEVPRLILQPLVENAIQHGVAPRSGPGLVQIASRRQNNRLWLEVRDDGVGLNAGARAQIRSGIGLANTRDRLACLYGDKHSLDFSDGGPGLAVRIEIPYEPASSGDEAVRVA